jgi:hypothetical protein
MSSEDWEDYREYQKQQKAKYDDIFFSKHLPALERRVKRYGLSIKQLSPSHWRVSNKKDDYVDFWQTLTFMRKGKESDSGFSRLEIEFKLLSK